MEERRIADYFVVAGLPDHPKYLDNSEFSEEHVKANHKRPPITDISVIFPALEEKLPEGYEVVTHTPTGLSADLNHGSLRTQECFLCFRRGRDKPPLVDIGVMYEGKELLMDDAEVVKSSVGGNIANVNNSTSQTFLTFRRGLPTMPCNALVVTDVCVVIASKGESPPHAFCCIYKNLNKGIVGSDVFLCYKKSMNRANLITYKPDVLYRYPVTDLPDFPFPNSVPLFCLPMGASLELWPKQANSPKPVFSTFVLTVSDAKHKVYGSAVTFYEDYSIDQLSEEQKQLLEYKEGEDGALKVNKSICVLSHWPFSDAFETWLMFLHSIANSTEPQSISVEQYIVQLYEEVPFPSPRTLLQLSTHSREQVIFTQPEDLPLPRSAGGFKHLLTSLGPDNCLQVMLLALTEQKMLLHSLRADTLTAVTEAVSSLLFPFKWQCPYIPLCPLGLVEVLHAPLPFLIGVDSRFFDLYDPPPDVSCIDLDTNIITVAEPQRNLLSTKILPKRAMKCLKASLEEVYYRLRNNAINVKQNITNNDIEIEMEFQKRKKEQAVELEIQEAFLKFMVLALKGYRNYLLPITKAPTVGTTDPQALFQLSDFLKSREKTHHKFYNLLMKTQMFIRFIEERSFVVDGDHGLAFFDECMERLSTNEDGEIRLIEFDSVQKSDKTIFVLPPEPTQNHRTYKHFLLDPSLLKTKRRNHITNFYSQRIIPGSPMARRTKHEIKSAQKLARKYSRHPDRWAKCLCGTSHTLYFMLLPSMLHFNPGKEKILLQQAYELLVKATKQRLACDEVCYRLMMQLCGEHSKPLLAVKLLVIMKKYGLQPNALTYGFYNRCVLEAEWPAFSSSSQLLWNKLRNVILGAAHFRWAARNRENRLSSAQGGSGLLEVGDRTESRSSLDSHENNQSESLLDKFQKSIFRGALNGSRQSVADSEDANEDEEEVDVLINQSSPPESPRERSRLLSRSESAGDANIIDKIEQSNKKTCSRTLNFDPNRGETLEEGEKISPRMAVTENDPLGALEPPCPTPRTKPVPEVTLMTSSNPIITDDPVLFRSSVHRSATFDGSPPSQKKMHRSESVPTTTTTLSLASIGNSLKLGLSRYSPSRISLRKADLKVPQQFIENAITTLSPNLKGKKSNEFLQGGISSIKSAANSVVKKLDEIKEAISTSATSTPVKMLSEERLGGGDASENVDYDSTDDSESGDRLRCIPGDLGSYRGSATNLRDSEEVLPPENLYPVSSQESVDSSIDISITSCSQCHNCLCLLYDEDIMAHWSAEDSNLNTVCQACSKPTVPLLTITITGHDKKTGDPFSIPYLNPLVLRKELENVLAEEGHLCLANAKFVTEHPIIYWNLIWAFERINVQTHLVSLYVQSQMGPLEKRKIEDCEVRTQSSSNMQPVEEGTDPLTQELTVLEQLETPIVVRCVWDAPRLHSGHIPMYILWDQEAIPPNGTHNTITKSFMQQIINHIRLNDLLEPVKSLASERNKLFRESGQFNFITHSVYRDIMFLACKVLGRTQVDLNVFDREYSTAYARATERNNTQFGPQDKPIGVASLFCRQYFKPLSLP